MRKVLLKCQTCGTDFHRKPCLVREGLNSFCSRSCYHKYDKGTSRIGRRGKHGRPVEERANYREVECRYCEKEFYRYRGHISPHAHIYCNRDCRTAYMRENPTPKAPPKQHEYNCLHCGDKFQRPINPRNKLAPKYCSPKCRREKGLITLNCNTCGTEFKKRRAVLRYANKVQGTENVYCSRECCGVATGDRTRGTTGRINKRNPDKYETLICDNCGGAFNKLKKAYAPQKKVCSKECKAALTAKAAEARK